MRILNLAQNKRTSSVLSICLLIILTASMAFGTLALNPRPVQAAFDITPMVWNSPPLQECMPFTGPTFAATCCTCSNPPHNVFFWLVDTGAGIPAWVNLDPNTGVLTGCPKKDSHSDLSNPFTFGVVCTELCSCPSSCTWADCWPFGDANFPCLSMSNTATVTLNVVDFAPPCVTDINPTFYPVAWEGLPFAMTMTAAGGVGPLFWTADGLPAGLSVTDPINGVISGTPILGTCGIYTVTASVSDNGTCPFCCPVISRPFILIVDCWANYPGILYGGSCDFKVEVGTGLTQGQANVLVDGSHKAALGGGQSQIFTSIPCESHLVMVDQTVTAPGTNTRFSVVGPNTKQVTDVENYAFFNYAQEVFIQTASNPAGLTQPPGAGYYAIGSNFTSNAPGTVENQAQAGMKYVFKNWLLPDGTTRPNANLAYSINQGGTVTAVYDTYYQLTLKSDYPAINENSWEKAGSTATWNLSLHAVPMQGFWGFFGGVQSPVNAAGSQVMNGPSTVEIRWRYNYTMPIVAIVIILLVIVGLIFLVRWLRSKPAAKSTAETKEVKAPSTARKTVTRKTASRRRTSK